MNVRNSGCCAVIASYNPEPGLVRNVAALLGQLTNVIVVDNGSSSESEITLSNVAQMPGCVVICLGTNKGIAHALNAGIRSALESNFEWIFTFDQDSTVTHTFALAMTSASRREPESNKIAIVAPQCIDAERKFAIDPPVSRRGEILEVMTSGSMMPASIFRNVGFFNEEFFMDYVDVEFCLRCRKAGYRIIKAPDAVLYHSLGTMSAHKIGKRTLHPTNHTAERRYYIVRNRVYLLLRYFTDISWSMLQFRLTSKEILKIIALEQNKRRKLICMARGALDALFGRMGKRMNL